ncbi:MAG: AmmeMemoRadiSam system protein A [Deltaproteobacteria bacterium]|nr:AmmeMemoRadiSam system protein A [Deltaproteobacteria bacterium]MBW2698031.1 AmmeMemoRadiSam system protein A [Deltaproteobacteria bacterium]
MSADTIQRGADPDALDRAHARRLLETARRAITTQLAGDQAEAPEAEASSSPLAAVRASFVTLRREGTLRGCIGSLEATEPLVESVWRNARRAAFHDPRFAPLSQLEFTDLEIHVSVLSPLEPMQIVSEADLLAQLRPGVDGLLIEEGKQRATFLPDVWQSLSDPPSFLNQLKQKAGLAPDHWSPGLRAWRYRTHVYE